MRRAPADSRFTGCRGRAAAGALFLLALPAAAVEPVDSERWNREYDPLFQKYAKHYFGPHFDWRWFKAQAITESNLDPAAHSSAGARGLMQILPSTFAEIRDANPHFVDIISPRWNIAAGIYYDRYLYRQPKWDPLADEEQLLLAFASYNAGLGNVLRAHSRTPPPADSWALVAPRAPQETQAYVARIITVKTGTPLKRPPPGRRGYSRHSMKAVEAAP